MKKIKILPNNTKSTMSNWFIWLIISKTNTSSSIWCRNHFLIHNFFSLWTLFYFVRRPSLAFFEARETRNWLILLEVSFLFQFSLYSYWPTSATKNPSASSQNRFTKFWKEKSDNKKLGVVFSILSIIFFSKAKNANLAPPPWIKSKIDSWHFQ